MIIVRIHTTLSFRTAPRTFRSKWEKFGRKITQNLSSRVKEIWIAWNLKSKKIVFNKRSHCDRLGIACSHGPLSPRLDVVRIVCDCAVELGSLPFARMKLKIFARSSLRHSFLLSGDGPIPYAINMFVWLRFSAPVLTAYTPKLYVFLQNVAILCDTHARACTCERALSIISADGIIPFITDATSVRCSYSSNWHRWWFRAALWCHRNCQWWAGHRAIWHFSRPHSDRMCDFWK